MILRPAQRTRGEEGRGMGTRRDLVLVNRGFAQGVLAALAVVVAYDQETQYREIVTTVGAEHLIAACEGEEDAEWSGLIRYGYVRPSAADRIADIIEEGMAGLPEAEQERRHKAAARVIADRQPRPRRPTRRREG